MAADEGRERALAGKAVKFMDKRCEGGVVGSAIDRVLIESFQKGMTMAISDLIGSSAEFRAALDNAAMVAPVDSAVLIQGEAGTGRRAG